VILSSFARSGPSRRRSALRTAGAVLVLAASAPVLVGCAGTSDAAGDGSSTATETIDFQLDWVKNQQFAGMFEADDKGYYEDAGLEVNFLDGGDVASTETIIAGGGAQIGISSNMARLADAIDAGADLVAIGAIYQVNPACLMTRPDTTITSAKDLAGLRIGSDESGLNDIKTLFAVNGLDPDFEGVRVGYDAAPLFDNQVDAYYCYSTNQPIPYEQNGTDFNNVMFADLGYESYAGLIVTTRSYLDEHRDAVVAFMKATTEGWNDALEDTSAAVDLVMDNYGADLGLDKDTAVAELDAQKDLMVSDFTDENGLFALDTDEISGGMYDTLKASGRTDLPEVEKAFDTSIVTDAAS